jgi:hypothetical protein
MQTCWHWRSTFECRGSGVLSQGSQQ